MCRKYTRHHSISLKSLIITDRSKWGGYVCRSSQFFNSRDSVFYPENQEIAEFERRHTALGRFLGCPVGLGQFSGCVGSQ